MIFFSFFFFSILSNSFFSFIANYFPSSSLHHHSSTFALFHPLSLTAGPRSPVLQFPFSSSRCKTPVHLLFPALFLLFLLPLSPVALTIFPPSSLSSSYTLPPPPPLFPSHLSCPLPLFELSFPFIFQIDLRKWV